MPDTSAPESAVQPLLQRLQAAGSSAVLPEDLQAAVTASHAEKDELTLTVAPAAWRPFADWLKAAGYEQFCDLTCVDWLPTEPRFEIVCQLYHPRNHDFLRIKTRVGEDGPLTLIPVWPAANWFEREVWDLFGVRFGEHPDLNRLLLPEAWQGHPLRKDYPTEGYR